jgi:hypothetical protein
MSTFKEQLLSKVEHTILDKENTTANELRDLLELRNEIASTLYSDTKLDIKNKQFTVMMKWEDEEQLIKYLFDSSYEGRLVEV